MRSPRSTTGDGGSPRVVGHPSRTEALVPICWPSRFAICLPASGRRRVVALAIAFSAFQFAELIGGNGFIAAFVAGMAFGNTLGQQCKFLYEFAEAEGQLLILLTFMVFGSVMIPVVLLQLNPMYFVFAVLALTVMRMLPISLSLLGAGVTPVTSAFLGWFGPRGLASVLYLLIILEGAAIAHKQEIFMICTLTITLSILLHGFTAVPAARWYGAHVSGMGECEEMRPVSETPFSNEVAIEK